MASGPPDGEKFRRSRPPESDLADYLRPWMERGICGVPLSEQQARPGFDPGRPITVLGLGHDRYTAKGIPRRLLRQNGGLGGSSNHIRRATSPPMSVRAISSGRRSKPSSSSLYEPKKGTILALQYNYVAPQHHQPYVRLGVSLRRRLHLGPIDPDRARLGANS